MLCSRSNARGTRIHSPHRAPLNSAQFDLHQSSGLLMWLLSTKTLKLVPFNGPEAVPGGYAILSHVWRKVEEEDTFQSVRLAAESCKRRANEEKSAVQGSVFNAHEDIIRSLSTQLQSLSAVVSSLQKRSVIASDQPETIDNWVRANTSSPYFFPSR